MYESPTASSLALWNKQQLGDTLSVVSDTSATYAQELVFPVPPLVYHSQHLLKANGSISGSEVASSILQHIPDLPSAIPVEGNPRDALACIDGRRAVPHALIRAFLWEMGTCLHNMQVGRGHRVAVVLPNGPELALAILAISTWASCVPLNAFGAVKELEADLHCAACDLVIGLENDTAIADLAKQLKIPFAGLIPDSEHAGIFELTPPTQMVSSPRRPGVEADRSAGYNSPDERFYPNQHGDEILVLFTSGTTGSKKLAPHLLADVLVATACISVSWKLTPADTNCNLMPLFHVGGIIRQVFSPILSGGCVICCPSFDPNIFWQLMLKNAFTWYYAAPTMHQLILQTGKSEGFLGGEGQSPRLRMIANAAGGLLPSLARELRNSFKCRVLPSYGMTECMPITSPPANYQLEKPGTSGVAVGPEIAILNVETMQPVMTGKEGPICVRGAPCFRGYGVLYDDKDNQSVENGQTFLPGGWFNTGDLGYMDEDGYLYITGRSKEVINRGGEIISPMEVEEAVLSHPDVQACVAFSTSHAVLQEVVGLLLVPKPDRPKLDLAALHEYLGEGRLAAPKWPQCLVYMDGVPKSHTNKLLRVKLGQRLGLPELNDNMYAIERIFQAKCPSQGTPVSVAIPCERVAVSPAKVQKVLQRLLITRPDQDIIVVPHPTKFGSLVAHCYNMDRLSVVKAARENVDAYAVPSHVCQLSGPFTPEHELTPPQPSDAISSIIQEAMSRGQGPTDPIVMALQELFQVLLNLDCLPAPDSNFFNLGGSSMLASQLASRIRKIYNVPFGGAEVFHHTSCNAIANIVRERQAAGDTAAPTGSGSVREASSDADPASQAASSLFAKNLNLTGTHFDPTRIDGHSDYWATLFQLLPLLVIYPFYQMTRLFLFFRSLLFVLHQVPGDQNLFKFVMTLVVFHFLWILILPLIFIGVKWTIIGKYRKGRYPLWSEYYLRWWLVDVLRKMVGRGIWGSHDVLLNFYYRLLGAKIGKYARISPLADIAEYDLVHIGEGACIEYCTVRGFGVDNGCIILGPVTVGHNSSVGARSVVAPFTSVPDGFHLGPSTTSYEAHPGMLVADNPTKHARYNRRTLPEPDLIAQILLARPITFAVDTFSHLPALAVFYWMVSMPWHHNEPFQTINDLMEWLCDVRRIPFYVGIRVARAVLAPLFHMAAAVLVKRYIIGKFKPGPRNTNSQWQLVRHYLAATLFSRENMQECTELLGRHYGLVSILYRLLGAKVGKRVFWPGHQPVFTGEFDLLEIGDDVVFGSRACMFCTTVDSCEPIILCAGSNVSDNTVVLPGSILGKNAVLASNSVCPENRYLPEASVWLGSRGGEPVLLEKGVEDTSRPIHASEVNLDMLQMEGDETTIRPFGRAFYHREAPYFVYPLSFIISYTVLSRIMNAIVHTIPILGALHLGAAYFFGWSYIERDYDSEEVSFLSMYMMLLSFLFLTNIVMLAVWLGVEVGSKNLFMGQRQEGRYNYDSCGYGQNWELYQITTQIRSFGRMNLLDFISGTPYMSSFFRMLGCRVGKDCCLYPSGGDPYMPEPDLVTMGDRCIIDCASVVCHLNTRGNFELARITMENNVTLRTRSRIQQGVYMESGSMMLEKSLAMTGEVIESDSVWIGAPATRLLSYDTSSIETRGSGSYGNSSLHSRGAAFV